MDAQTPTRLDEVEGLLTTRGHNVGPCLRVAAGRSGIAVGFPTRPMIHVSWWVLGALAVLLGVRRRSRAADGRE